MHKRGDFFLKKEDRSKYLEVFWNEVSLFACNNAISGMTGTSGSGQRKRFWPRGERLAILSQIVPPIYVWETRLEASQTWSRTDDSLSTESCISTETRNCKIADNPSLLLEDRNGSLLNEPARDEVIIFSNVRHGCFGGFQVCWKKRNRFDRDHATIDFEDFRT